MQCLDTLADTGSDRRARAHARGERWAYRRRRGGGDGRTVAEQAGAREAGRAGPHELQRPPGAPSLPIMTAQMSKLK